MKRLSVLLVLVALLAAACGSDDDSSSSDPTESTDGTEVPNDLPPWAAVSAVSDDLTAKPTFELEPVEDAGTEVLVEDVVVGDGDEVVAGSTVEVQYVGTLTDGTEFDSSWDRGEPIEFSLDAVIPGWGQGLEGAKVGGRRLLVIPSDLGYGPTGAPPDIPGGAALVFVVDVLGVTPPPPPGATVTNVSSDLSTPPTFDVEPAAEGPTELVIEDVVEGDGDEVVAGDTVEVQYTGVLTNGTEFDSSWSRGETVEFPLDGVIPGWSEGLVGMKVGGRRLLVIPPELAYGATPPAGAPIPPDATLVFVVDMVSIGDATAATDQ